uniref:Uncharacterized protein n=1 Tax=Oryza punctata TaxID=4537 RepID=A0A0E0L3K6_ORYPU
MDNYRSELNILDEKLQDAEVILHVRPLIDLRAFVGPGDQIGRRRGGQRRSASPSPTDAAVEAFGGETPGEKRRQAVEAPAAVRPVSLLRHGMLSTATPAAASFSGGRRTAPQATGWWEKKDRSRLFFTVNAALAVQLVKFCLIAVGCLELPASGFRSVVFKKSVC